MKVSRRNALRTAIVGGVAGGLGACSTTGKDDGNRFTGAHFAHGVASGEPTTSGFLIWSRISLANTSFGSVSVRYEVAADKTFTDVTLRGSVKTSATRDWTLKTEVEGLYPGRTYYYRFIAGDVTSPTGRCRTLPIGSVETVRFATVSCSNYAFGYFNVYDAIARRDDIDAVIHLGDYIYEYGTEGYGGDISKQLGREHSPDKEIVSLSDYRIRHAQYKSDPGSIAMHSAHALIPIWDDHETANNSWEGGAENHDLSEGEWKVRRSAALRAYYEWMPVRDPAKGMVAEELLRGFQWGDLVTLATLETRLMARSEQLDYATLGSALATSEGLAKFKTVDLVNEGRELLGHTNRMNCFAPFWIVSISDSNFSGYN